MLNAKNQHVFHKDGGWIVRHEGSKKISRLFEKKKDAKGEMVLTEYESDHETWEKPLQKALAQAEADKDDAIIKAAQKIMELLQPKQAAMGKFNIQAENIQGIVQAEKIDTLTQNFGNIPKDK